jgi:hypothetical protein
VDEQRLDVLHDHYKETFALIREREGQRDRLFLVLIGLFALLVLEVQYPANFGGALGPLTVSGAEVNLGALPLPGLLSASWVLTVAVALRYCQAVMLVERQYDYLHRLEEKISGELGDDDLYRREGRSYLDGYPLFQDWAWICYVFLFPIAAAIAVVALVAAELTGLPYPWPNKAFDTVAALALIVSFYLYRWHPPKEKFGKLERTLQQRWGELRGKEQRQDTKSSGQGEGRP